MCQRGSVLDAEKQACEATLRACQMALMSRFCKFQKQNRELPYASLHWGKPGSEY